MLSGNVTYMMQGVTAVPDVIAVSGLDSVNELDLTAVLDVIAVFGLDSVNELDLTAVSDVTESRAGSR